MKRTLWLALALVASLCVLATPALWSAPKKDEPLTVRVLSARVMSQARFLAKPVTEVTRGETLVFVQAERDWYRVKTSAGKSGWIHRSSVVDRKITLSSHPGRSGASASPEEIELAGRGFTPEVEAQYRAQHQNLDFSYVDQIEKLEIDVADVAKFAKQGQVGGEP